MVQEIRMIHTAGIPRDIATVAMLMACTHIVYVLLEVALIMMYTMNTMTIMMRVVMKMIMVMMIMLLKFDMLRIGFLRSGGFAIKIRFKY